MRNKIFSGLVLLALVCLAPASPANADAPVGSEMQYAVQYGDSLNSIAAQFGVPLETLAQMNALDARAWLFVGQVLHVPATAFAGAPAAAPTYITYIVQYGDTLWGIAWRYGVSMATLMRVNGIYNPNWIFAGTRLRIPRVVAPPPGAGTYVIQAGDTLSGIAVRLGTTVYALMIANNIANPNLIYAGMRLVVPATAARTPTPGTPLAATATRTITPTRALTPAPPAGTLTPSPTPSVLAVLMQNLAFVPRAVVLRVGSRALWTNVDAVQHTVTSGAPGALSGLFDSGNLNAGQNFQFTFANAGTFAFFCRIHGAAMTGTITVNP